MIKTINARAELEEILADNGYDVLDIKCASLNKNNDDYEEEELCRLRVKHTQRDLEQFLQVLGKYNYDSGFGSQELFGIVWLRDGVWLARGEYDGCEWWEVRICPLIPDYLLDEAQGNDTKI